MPHKLKSGRWQADQSNTGRGIPRTRRNFATRKEAEAYERKIEEAATDNLLGRRTRRLFGEALSRYLTEVSPAKKNHAGDLDTARVLRVPFQHGGRWLWIENLPLEAAPGQMAIAQGIAAYTADRRAIERRAYLFANYYEQRAGRWYQQPASIDGQPPQPRHLVTDRATLDALATAEGRGPYSPETLRIRQALVRSVLKCCWQRWDWISQELGTKVALESKTPGRKAYLSPAQLAALIEAAAASEYGQHLADAIEGAALIGWRRENLLNLQWGQVVFPIFDNEGRELQMGIITCSAEDVKNSQPLAQPMSAKLYALLARRWNLRQGATVFHQGNGKPFGDFRKAWASALKRADIDPAFRWHDLRHTWASHLIQAGATPRQLQELGGWKSTAMPNHYAHLCVDHLRAVVEKL